jgi:protein SCO1
MSVQRRTVLQSLICGALVTQTVGQVAAAVDTSRWTRLPEFPDLALLDHDGQAIRLRPLLQQSRITLINFMFTGCTTVCPPGTALLRDALRLLKERADTRDAHIVSITVDPLADGPAQLRQYARRFDIELGQQAGWTLVTGVAAEIAQTVAAFGVPSNLPSAHPSLIWLGDVPRQRWTRVSGLNPPQTLVDLVLESRR